MSIKSLSELLREWDWASIRDCPGRYVLREDAKDVSPNELTGHDTLAREYQVASAQDLVCVLAIPGGGLISYRKQDGRYVHTLCNSDGFRRKLEQLRIPFDGAKSTLHVFDSVRRDESREHRSR